MARTKKQTLENASERKRLIQEELLRASLSLKHRKDNSLDVGPHSTPKAVVAGGAESLTESAECPGAQRLATGAASSHPRGIGTFRGTTHAEVSGGSKDHLLPHPCVSTMSNVTRMSRTQSVELPQAVICIPDICKSPSKNMEEESFSRASRELSPRGQGSQSSTAYCRDGRAMSSATASLSPLPKGDAKNLVFDPTVKEVGVLDLEESQHKHRNNLRTAINVSLKALKAASEQKRQEKSRKFHENPAVISSERASFQSLRSSSRTGSGRRSPRVQSQISTPEQYSPDTRSPGDSIDVMEERPKINIFTDNLGLDLGKRIRSPRRMSEDMIPLPIFSARRWSNSLRELTTTGDGNSLDDNSVSDIPEMSSKTSPNSNDCTFKSPNVSPASSKKSSTPSSTQRTPSSSSSRSCESSAPARKRRDKRSRENSPQTELSVQKFSEEEDQNSGEEEKSRSYPLRKSKLGVSRELQYESIPRLRKSSRIADNFSDVDTSSCEVKSEGQTESSVSKLGKSRSHKKSKSKSEKHAEIEEMMSSICKEIIKEVVISKSESDTEESRQTMESKVVKSKSSVNSDLVESLAPDMAETRPSVEMECADSCVPHGSEECVDCFHTGHQLTADENGLSPKEKGLLMLEDHPSLLCAMLVGGKEVAHSYRQERERYKPQVVEISDSETDVSRATSPSGQPRIKKIDRNVSTEGEAAELYDPKLVVKTEEAESFDIQLDAGISFKTEPCVEEPSMYPLDEKTSTLSEGIAMIKSKNLQEKNLKIDFLSSMKALNESVLKLLEIDVEEEFMDHEALMLDDIQEKRSLGDTQLYQVISQLVTKLKDSSLPYAVPVDLASIDKLVESCPGNAHNNIRKLNTVLQQDKLYQRLKELELSVSVEGNVQEPAERAMDRPANSTSVPAGQEECGKMDNPITTPEEPQKSNKGLDIDQQFLSESDNSIQKTKSKILPGNVGTQDAAESSYNDVLPHEEAINFKQEPQESCLISAVVDSGCTMNTSCSSLNDSLCDLDLDAITSAATEPLNIDIADKISNDSTVPNGLPKLTMHNICTPSKDESPDANVELSPKGTFSIIDFDGSQNNIPLASPSVLQRVNSSPQINVKSILSNMSSSNSLPNLNNQGKSKLGGKIPVPGTTYSGKSAANIIRMPRIISEPKPLCILSDMEKTSSASEAFFCSSLQKYLSIPSHRMIVMSDKRQEMELVDTKAREEEERREILERNKTLKEKQADEETEAEFLKHEPDFDEVDGMLFMSFSSEVELVAHIRVEKALDWDKDDTMLRISRAKAFEEAKAQNENMQCFKLKHLRGQHMRWKKYRRLYGNEVKTLLEAQEKGIPLSQVAVQKKTSDVTKIKGWKKKQESLPNPNLKEIKENVLLVPSEYYNPEINYYMGVQSAANTDYSLEFSQEMEEDGYSLGESSFGDQGEGVGPMDLTPYAKRCQMFSYQKAHKQLFKELNMDWEARMIHRKLGGWSLKGNRPKAFSQAARKRRAKESKVGGDGSRDDMKDTCLELSPTPSEWEMDVLASEAPCGLGGTSQRKKRTTKLVYPLLTERMARNALKTLETEDIMGSMNRRKKRRPRSSHVLPSLTLMPLVRTPPLFTNSQTSTPLSMVATRGSSPATDLSAAPTPQQSPRSCSSTPLSAVTTPLKLQLKEELVQEEGVDLASGNISSPSTVVSQSSVKSCGKPGCRYGCICHLCFITEEPLVAPSSPVAITPKPVCEKEYCRLGCICDSIDPEKATPAQPHCGKPVCMLKCECVEEVGSQEGNDDIPYLPSMKRRPKPGERFSNLPQREKTHRSAKNLDAITRKALMLYETSEIYCEKVERTRKKMDTSSSPTSSPLVSPGSALVSAQPVVYTEVDVTSVSASPPQDTQASIMFKAVNLVTSEATSVAASQLLNSEQLDRRARRNRAKLTRPTIILDDVRQMLPVVEPSAHKRKRKSHPLSNEIFTNSTCARTQPYIIHQALMDKSSRLNPHAVPVCRSAASQTPDPVGTNKESNGIKEKLPFSDSLSDGKHLEAWQNSMKSCDEDLSIGHMAGSSVSVSRERRNLQPPAPKNEICSDSGSDPQGSARHHGWHTSMVCLKARPSSGSQNKHRVSNEDDVQEEDEVKLLEFAANCNWEGAKKEILGKVAQCLTRGHYPQPRNMNVCEFVVEILPKAHQPSIIPAELRAKLPGQMYSIRVRITRRDVVSKVTEHTSPQVIDISGNSPMKPSSSFRGNEKSLQATAGNPSNPSVHSQDSNSLLSSQSYGISGLCQLNVNSSIHSKSDTKSLSAPSSRRSSMESILSSDMASKIEVKQGNSSLSLKPTDTQNKICDSAIKSVGAVVSRRSTISGILPTGNDIATSAVRNSSSIPMAVLSGSSSTDKSGPSQVKLTKNTSTPLICPLISKDIKYRSFPGTDQVVKVLDCGSSGKQTKMIAVSVTMPTKPGDRTEGQTTVPLVTLPVSGSHQTHIVPFLPAQDGLTVKSSSKQIMLKLPVTQAGTHFPILMQPIQGKAGQRLQFVPYSLVSSATTTTTTPCVTQATVISSTSVQTSSTPSSNKGSPNEETIMVFDAADMRVTHLTRGSKAADSTTKEEAGNAEWMDQSVVNQKSQCTGNDPSLLFSDEVTVVSSEPMKSGLHTTVTESLNGPIMSAEVSLSNSDTTIEGLLNEGDKHSVCNQPQSLSKIQQAGGQRKESDSEQCEAEQNDFQGKIVPSVVDKEPVKCMVQHADCDSLSRQHVLCSHSSAVSENHGEGKTKEETATSLSVHHSDRNISHASCSASPGPKIVKARELMKETSSNPQGLTVVTGDLDCGSGNKSLHHKRSLQADQEGYGAAPVQKKAKTLSEGFQSVDEDSNLSMGSVLGGAMSGNCSQLPQDRPKSVMSTALSTGSSDEIVLMLSSEEEIDVGEEDLEQWARYQERAERALQNDHGYMFSMGPSVAADEPRMVWGTLQNKYDAQKGKRKTMNPANQATSRGKHHNALERLRRSRLKALFDDLKDQVSITTGNSYCENTMMSKVHVLDAAKQVVLQLVELQKNTNRELLEQKLWNNMLREKLKRLKAHASQSSQCSNDEIGLDEQQEGVSSPQGSLELVDLVSSSSGDEKGSDRAIEVITPVYEDISDSEDQGAPRVVYDNVSDSEYAQPTYEDISDPDEN